MTVDFPSEGCVHVNGVRLHYLDWGGDGPAMLFLAGMGCNAHIFARFAPRFTDRYHVLAMTRRGHGESDHPESGYDLETLVEDIHQFLDALHTGPVILVGHSLAGVELGRFAVRYPDRTLALIYLDAGFDRTSAAMKAMRENNPLESIKPPGLDADYTSIEDYFAMIKRAFPNLAVIWDDVMEEQSRHEVTILEDGRVVDRMSDAIGQELGVMMNGYTLEDRQIHCPVLSFYAFQPSDYFISRDFMTEEQIGQVRAYMDDLRPQRLRECIRGFQQKIPQAEIIEIHPGHHYCFMLQEELVFARMREFLERALAPEQ
jgi:pimeloyl-ACP methyl ester carboxylesterase